MKIDRFSLVAASLLLGFYVLSLLFSMKTHRHLYELSLNGENGDSAATIAEDGHHAPIGKHVGILLGASIVLVFVSEVLVASLETAIKTMGLTQLFTGVILIPLFGGVVEYIAVITFARKNKMDLSRQRGDGFQPANRHVRGPHSRLRRAVDGPADESGIRTI